MINDVELASVLPDVLQMFLPQRTRIAAIGRLGSGRINDTYLITIENRRPMVLQRINPTVFPDPVCIADNAAAVTAHLAAHRERDTGAERFPMIIAARDGASCVIDRHGNVWRAIEYVQGGVSHQVVQGGKQAFEVGRMLGRFHALLADFDGTVLCTPVPGFHDLPGYCRIFERALSRHRRQGSVLLTTCCEEVHRRLVDASGLVEAMRRGDIAECIIHGDPKCDNILFDRDSGQAVALIDFDTVSKGLLQFDLGDCLRSVCNVVGESPADLGGIMFDLDLCRQLLAGYRASGAMLPQGERHLIFRGVRLLTYELGVRFLTDYLAGDRYFKISDPDDNLQRAAVQFALLKRIEEQQGNIESLVDDVWK